MKRPRFLLALPVLALLVLGAGEEEPDEWLDDAPDPFAGVVPDLVVVATADVLGELAPCG